MDPTIEDRCGGRGGTVDHGLEPGVGLDSAKILDPESGGDLCRCRDASISGSRKRTDEGRDGVGAANGKRGWMGWMISFSRMTDDDGWL
ncbi:hypothetical protein BHE74_00055886 [Ensete ventricosum]|nr:hypothetical protein BHE74_00055886 [Ensete ventricosum]